MRKILNNNFINVFKKLARAHDMDTHINSKSFKTKEKL